MAQEVAMMMVRKRSEEPSEKHIRILEFLAKYMDENDRPPSIREICSEVGISSTSVVNYDLDQLEKRGYIVRDGRVSRGLRLTEKVKEVLGAFGDLFRIPVLGPIAAGLPLPDLQPGRTFYTDNESHAVEIARSLLPSKEKGNDLFALEVKGDSMIDAMINDGDIVVMKPAVEARNGEMVAVWLPENNEATLKYFFKEKDRYRLQPANPTMAPIYVNKNKPLEIKGKVVMVIRKMETMKQ
ncbi:MAG: repressor LexA [Anaerolineae bacterium CFX3]|jgi:repressor LexA|nr:repressor LexA [Anaerolineae bacterium]MBL1172524.1 repressor LexA [Chloroflexota bacterium]MBW7920248.1 repressor LexA [Anaerolineales bacterium]MCE7906236.1 repressor LexA [Anaerolineae bacterium CFX3]MDL1926305.1 repressor LexA [Anaerolineae bacterium AMX1]OQY85442.1 MAG: repressor LexA [Anaerolineae bacterium UTCFX3]